MKIVVIGGGSTGLVYGSKLSEVADVDILVRRAEQADILNREGVTFQLPDGQTQHFTPKFTLDPTIMDDADLIIGLTKCYDVPTVAELIAKHSVSESIILPLHNGLGTQEIYNETLGADRVLAGTQYLITNRTSDTTVIFGANVRTIIGEQTGKASPRSEKLVDIMNKAGFDASTSDNMKQATWDKFQIAVCQHALSALNNMTFGQLRESEEVLATSRQLNDEFQLVAAAEGLDFPDEDSFDRVLANMKRGAIHKSSTCQDLLAGRPTEIDFINGAISELGKKYGIPTPANDAITQEVHEAESHS